MTIASTWSTAASIRSAFESAMSTLVRKLGGDPTLLLIYVTEGYPAGELRRLLDFLPASIRVQGATSSRAVMTEDGIHSEAGRALGLFGIRDPHGIYGVGAAPLDVSPQTAGRQAAAAALTDSGRPNRRPALVWMNASPGDEEAVIRGIQEVVGRQVPILGGSAADDHAAGHWKLLTRSALTRDAVVVSVLAPRYRLAHAQHNACRAAGRSGVATAATGRRLERLDDRPAAEVYREWTADRFAVPLPADGKLLAAGARAPLGRPLALDAEPPSEASAEASREPSAAATEAVGFAPLQPYAMNAGGALELFAEVQAGESLSLLDGAPDCQPDCASRTTAAAIEGAAWAPDDPLGALLAHSAGSLIVLGARLPQVVDGLNATLRGRPFLGFFSFGEQGAPGGGAAAHGNLSVSSLVFARPLPY